MTHVFPSLSEHSCHPPRVSWFAKESEGDLELDEGLDDFDDGHPKPPSRRPLLIILLLLVVASAGYLAMNPDLFSSLISLIASPASQTADDHALDASPNSPTNPDRHAASLPSPAYQEGAVVSIVTKPGAPGAMTLSRDAQGTQPGPTVKTGELLTIVDGAFMNQSWMYLVNTKSGASGWINEHSLQPSR